MKWWVVMGLTSLVISVKAQTLINEVAFDEPPNTPDWVELFNPGPGPETIDGWRLDDKDTASNNEIVLHLSTPVPAGCFVRVLIDVSGPDETDFSDQLAVLHTGTATTVSLAASEDELYLFRSPSLSSATVVDFVAWYTDDAYNGLADQAWAISAGFWPEGVAVKLTDTGYGYSVGRRRDGVTTHTPEDWTYFSLPTLGATNVPPEICGNGIDDNLDGQVDCADGACAEDPACALASAISVEEASRVFSPEDPARSRARLFFRVGSAEQLKSLTLYDVGGRLQRRLVVEDRGLGINLSGISAGQVEWDGRDDSGVVLPPGLYLALLEARSPSGAMTRGRATLAIGSPRRP